MDEFEYPDYDRFEDELNEHEMNELALDGLANDFDQSHLDDEGSDGEDEHPACFHCCDSGIDCDYCGQEMSQD